MTADSARLLPRFVSLLSEQPGLAEPPGDLAFAADLRLDQIVTGIVGAREERTELTELLYRRVSDLPTVRYRHEVFADLEDPRLFEAIKRFSGELGKVRAHLAQLAGMRSVHQRQGWFLDAASTYCDAVRELTRDLASLPVTSTGLLAFRGYLDDYAASAGFTLLVAETGERKDDLAGISYLVRIKGGKVEVSRYDGESDYSTQVEKTFERFRQGAVREYRIEYRTWPGMNHVGAQILGLVARLFSEQFTALDDYCRRHEKFFDPVIGQFDSDVQFYLAYLEHMAPLRKAGLRFCYPELSAGSKEVHAGDTFDLALAAKLTRAGEAVVTNDFDLRGRERIFVVSGPNQGGKTTFARIFGQLHHLAAIGCPVPGSSARLFACDQIFTHFEREEDLANLTGKLEDDLLRIRHVLRAATSRSIVIMNEIFTSTSLSDARFLGRKLLDKIIELDLLCVYVTFIDELASHHPSVVSVASTIVPDNPAERTYKVVRKPADGLAYALAIAERHGVTYAQLKKRLGT